MKRFIALFLAFALILSGCSSATAESVVDETNQSSERVTEEQEEATSADNSVGDMEESAFEEKEGGTIPYTTTPDVTFTGLDDEALLDYVEDNVYLQLISELNSEEYVVEGVKAIYYPKEYLEELAFNSQENVYFGYTASELNEQFQGTKYVFTLGDDGTTTVVPMETLNSDAYEHVLDNIVIGTGVILVCVTVSIATAGTAPAVSMIFAASAKTATSFAVSTAVFSGVSAAMVTGYQTEDFEKAMEAGITASAEGFKWGAITGAIMGGGQEAFVLHKGTAGGLTMNQVAIIQQESNLPIGIIKQFSSIEEYNLYKEAGLYTKMVNGKIALVRNIDLEYTSKLANGEEVTNLVRMEKGYAPIDPATGKAYELHHIGQEVDSPLAILTRSEHTGNGNNGILHDLSIADGDGVHANISDSEWATQRKQFWMKYAASLL